MNTKFEDIEFAQKPEIAKSVAIAAFVTGAYSIALTPAILAFSIQFTSWAPLFLSIWGVHYLAMRQVKRSHG